MSRYIMAPCFVLSIFPMSLYGGINVIDGSGTGFGGLNVSVGVPTQVQQDRFFGPGRLLDHPTRLIDARTDVDVRFDATGSIDISLDVDVDDFTTQLFRITALNATGREWRFLTDDIGSNIRIQGGYGIGDNFTPLTVDANYSISSPSNPPELGMPTGGYIRSQPFNMSMRVEGVSVGMPTNRFFCFSDGFLADGDIGGPYYAVLDFLPGQYQPTLRITGDPSPLPPDLGSDVITVEGPSGGFDISAAGINDSGMIVGQFWPFHDPNDGSRVYVLQEGNYSAIDIPNAHFSDARDVNSRNEVVGQYEDSNGDRFGFIADGQTVESINFPGAVETDVRGINDHRNVVGTSRATDGTRQGFVFDGMQYTTLNNSNWKGIFPTDINNNNDIVGQYLDANDVLHSFLFDETGYSTIDFPGVNVTTVSAINDHGQYVGIADGQWFLFDGVDYRLLELPGVTLIGLPGINNAGDIVGGYEDQYNLRYGVHLRGQFVVPLPAGAWMGLALLGGAGMIAVVRRRMRRAA